MTLNYSWSVPHLTSPKNGYIVAHQSTYHFPQTLQNYTKVFPVSRGSRSGRSGSTATAATQERPQRPQRCRTSMDGRSAEPSGNKGLWGSVDIYIILYLCIIVLQEPTELWKKNVSIYRRRLSMIEKLRTFFLSIIIFSIIIVFSIILSVTVCPSIRNLNAF